MKGACIKALKAAALQTDLGFQEEKKSSRGGNGETRDSDEEEKARNKAT